MDPLQLRDLGPGIPGWPMGQARARHSRMARRGRHDPRLGSLRRDRRHQGRRAHDRGGRRPLLPGCRGAASREDHAPEATGTAGGQAPPLLQGPGAEPSQATRRRDAADVPQRLDLLRPVRGQAPGVPAVVPALLSGLRLDRAQRRAGPEAAQGHPTADATFRRRRDEAHPRRRGQAGRLGLVRAEGAGDGPAAPLLRAADAGRRLPRAQAA